MPKNLLTLIAAVALPIVTYAQQGQAPKVDIKEVVSPAHVAVCKSSNALIPAVYKDESAALMTHMLGKSIYFAGGPYILFVLNDKQELTGEWQVCIRTRTIAGLQTATPEPPYVLKQIGEIGGIQLTCPKEPPGPASCRDMLAEHMGVNKLIAVGAPRITDSQDGQTVTFWVPIAARK